MQYNIRSIRVNEEEEELSSDIIVEDESSFPCFVVKVLTCSNVISYKPLLLVTSRIGSDIVVVVDTDPIHIIIVFFSSSSSSRTRRDKDDGGMLLCDGMQCHGHVVRRRNGNGR